MCVLALRYVTVLLLAGLGLVNFLAGFLYLFPGAAEVLFADLEALAAGREVDSDSSVSVWELMRGRYGATAVLLIALSQIQLYTACALGALPRWGPLSWIAVGVAALSATAELWGWYLKGELIGLNLFGLAVSGLLALVSFWSRSA